MLAEIHTVCKTFGSDSVEVRVWRRLQADHWKPGLPGTLPYISNTPSVQTASCTCRLLSVWH